MMRNLVLLVAACGSGTPRDTTTVAKPAAVASSATMPADAVGAGYLSYRKVTDQPYRSRVHGDRMVDVYVSPGGEQAYLGDGEIPVGTVVVKAATDGAIFVMEKRASGFAPDHLDWYYALHWLSPPPEQKARFGDAVDWRSPSPRVSYCWECHDDYDRGLGGLTPSSILPR